MDRGLIDAFEIKFKSAFRNFKSAILASALLLALCSSAEAQEPKKIPRIGYLSQNETAAESVRSESITARSA